MKVWVVLALLAMGLGCSEEPREPPPTTTMAPTTTTMAPTTTTMAPTTTTMALTLRSKQWSSASRALVVEACIDYIEDGADPVLVRIMALQGITTRELCRCAQNLFERQFTWGDTDIFWSGGIPDPSQKAMGAVGFMSASPWPAGKSILETGCREEMLD